MQLSKPGPLAEPQKSEKVEIRVARSLCEVEALREPWSAWPGHRDSDIDFHLMKLQSDPEVVRPHVIALYQSGKPQAVLVGRLERKASLDLHEALPLGQESLAGPSGQARTEDCAEE